MLSAKADQVRLTIVREPGEAYQASPGTKRERRYRIQPPPKIVLEVDGDDPKCNWLENPRTFLMARLPQKPDILFGKTVESIQRKNDEAAFVFSDLSCQEAGEHRLRFTLFSRDSDSEPAYMVKHIESQPFVVVANRSARRRSDRSKTSPRLRHRLGSREVLVDRVRLEPKKSRPSLKLSEEPNHITHEHAVLDETSSPIQGLPLSPSPSSPTMGASTNDPLFGYLSSPQGYVNMFNSPLTGFCSLGTSRAQMAPYTPSFSSAGFSMPLTPRDSALPMLPWCIGDSPDDIDQMYEALQDTTQSIPMWTGGSPFVGSEIQSQAYAMLPPQWRMGTHL